MRILFPLFLLLVACNNSEIPLDHFPISTEPPPPELVDECVLLLRKIRDKEGVRRDHLIREYLASNCSLDSMGWQWGDRWITTSLLHEATQAPFEILNEVLKSGADPNLLIRGHSPTHLVFLRRRDSLSYDAILKHGGDLQPPGARTVFEALSRAEGSRMNPVRFLLERGEVDLRGQNVARLLVEAMYYRRDSLVVQQLLERGADPNGEFTWTAEDCAVCPYGLTPTFVAANHGIEQLKLFKKYGADFAIRAEGNQTLIEEIAGGGNAKTIEYLIESGAPIGADALYIAADYQRADVVKVLLENGVDPNAPAATYPSEETVLSQVLRCCGEQLDQPLFGDPHLDVVELLLRNKVVPRPQDLERLFPIATRQDPTGRRMRRLLRELGYL